MSLRVEFDCGRCELSISGETWDPHELPRLFCPDCSEELEAGVVR